MRLAPWRRTPRGGISTELLRLPVLMLLFQHISEHPARLGIWFGPLSRALAAKGIMPPSSWLFCLLEPTFPCAASLTQALVVSFSWKPSRCSCLNCHLWSMCAYRGIFKIKTDVSDMQELQMCVFFFHLVIRSQAAKSLQGHQLTSGPELLRFSAPGVSGFSSWWHRSLRWRLHLKV